MTLIHLSSPSLLYSSLFFSLLEVKLPYYPVCTSVGWLVGRSVGRSDCHNFLKRAGCFTSMLQSEHLFLSLFETNNFHSNRCLSKNLSRAHYSHSLYSLIHYSRIPKHINIHFYLPDIVLLFLSFFLFFLI